MSFPTQGVHQGSEAGRPDHESVDALEQAAPVVEEVRGQPLAVPLQRLRRGVGQQPGGPGRPRALDDGGDAEAPEGEVVHGASIIRASARGASPIVDLTWTLFEQILARVERVTSQRGIGEP